MNGGGIYQQGQSCTVSAIANNGYAFIKWTLNGNQVSTNVNYTFTVTNDATYVAHFESGLSQVDDFQVNDCYGNEVHLYDVLDGGQYVLIEFFRSTTGPCQQTTPKIVESYYAMGCNMHDVFYIGISPSDSDAACQNWCQNYGVEYPIISGPAGGTTICNHYGIQAYPTITLIAPNRTVVIQDLWPINNAQSVINALEAQGLEQYNCNP